MQPRTEQESTEHRSTMNPPPGNPLRWLRVLDGGLATELEFLGADLSGPLWSAHVLENQPELIVAVHRAYLEAGAGCIATASYQVSRRGYAELGLPPERADAALLRAVALARQARAEHAAAHPATQAGTHAAAAQPGTQAAGPQALVAASLGPYGAALHNGAEYHGNYDCGFADLVHFHRERLAVLADCQPAADLLAFETIPSLEEARAILTALAEWPSLRAWLSFTCRDDRHLAHGEPLGDAVAALLDEFTVEQQNAPEQNAPQLLGIGINCIPPQRVPALLGQLRSRCPLPILVYPNSGEQWDADARRWTGSAEAFEQAAAGWFALGADVVGGCCRTRPEHIRSVARAVAARAGSQPLR